MPHIWRTSYKADIMCQDPSIEQVLTWGAKAHVACHQVCVVFLQCLALGKSLLHMWTIPPPSMPQSPRRSPGSRKVLKPLLSSMIGHLFYNLWTFSKENPQTKSQGAKIFPSIKHWKMFLFFDTFQTNSQTQIVTKCKNSSSKFDEHVSNAFKHN